MKTTIVDDEKVEDNGKDKTTKQLLDLNFAGVLSVDPEAPKTWPLAFIQKFFVDESTFYKKDRQETAVPTFWKLTKGLPIFAVLRSTFNYLTIY